MPNASFFLIAVSSKMWQKPRLKKEASAKKAAKKAAKAEESAAISSPVEKTTLGDIEELAALKEKLSKDNK